MTLPSSADVSLGTVSNVLNDNAVVAPQTRRKVLEAIHQTGFVRSTAAHQLRVGKSRTVGVVLLDIANPFFSEMVRGAEGVLRDKGYVLMVCSSDESVERERRYLRVLEEHRVDGLLITPGAARPGRGRRPGARGTPTVLLDRDGAEHELCSATVDDVRGGELAADHFYALGHETVAFVNGPASIRQCADRREGPEGFPASTAARARALLHELAVQRVDCRPRGKGGARSAGPVPPAHGGDVR